MSALILSAYLALPIGTQASGAYAAIFKCIDARGNTTYTSSRCSLDESTQLINKSAKIAPELDCGVAEILTTEVVSRMKEGELSAKLFNSYGGMSNLSPFVVDLVSYIYSFHGNDAVKSERIAQLSTKRCKAGSFGSVGTHCEIFPAEFIERMGGCPRVSGSVDQSFNTTLESLSPESADLYSLPLLEQVNAIGNSHTKDSTPTRSNPMPTTQNAKHIECRQRLNTIIEQTNEQMSRDLDQQNQKLLKIRYHHLKKQLYRC